MRRSRALSNPPPPDTAEETATLDAGQTFGTHFRVKEELREGGSVGTGTDTRTGKAVLLLPVSAEREKTLRPLVGLAHAHLAPLLALEPFGRGFVAVAATVQGETLAERLEAIGKKPSVDAVRSALRLADALATMHEAGGVHGTLTPDTIIVEPTDGESPRLAWGTSTDGALHTPERAPDGPPSIADDTWAVAALLHWMLTGKAPPPGGYADEAGLEAAGVSDVALRPALLHTLTSSRPERQTDLRPLRRELARWFVEHAAEEPIVPSHRPTAPPPLPPSRRPSHRPTALSTPAQKKKLGAFSVGAIVLGVGAGIALTFLRPKRVQVIAVPEKEAPTAPSALELGEVPVTGENETRLGTKLATCVAGYLPKGAFGKTPEVEWMCSEVDPRVGSEKLHAAIVSSAPKGAVTDAMKIFSRIGWYALPAFAVVRAGCCPDAKPLALPEEHCEMSSALREVGEAVVATKDVETPLKKYTESIHCELNRGGAKMLRRAERPAGGEDTAFLELVKHLE